SSLTHCSPPTPIHNTHPFPTRRSSDLAEIRHASGLAMGQDRDDAGGSGRAARLPRRSAMENIPRRAAWLEDRRKVSTLGHVLRPGTLASSTDCAVWTTRD